MDKLTYGTRIYRIGTASQNYNNRANSSIPYSEVVYGGGELSWIDDLERL